MRGDADLLSVLAEPREELVILRCLKRREERPPEQVLGGEPTFSPPVRRPAG